jgi:gluconokinase
MQPGRRVLAVDIGTSSVRALLYDGRAQPVPGAEVHLPYAPRVAADGTAEVDADQLVGLAQLAVDRVLRRSRRRDVAALAGAGLSSLWHGLIAADSGARALTPLYLWSDTRAASAALELARRHDPEEIRARTGCPLHSSYWPAKMLWLRRLRPDLWRPGVHWVSIGDLLFWRLFGRLGTSLSMASGTGLFLLRERRWDEDLLRTLEVDPASLPELAESAQGLEPGPDRRWPQLSQLPWLHALGDGALANLGSGCLDPSRRALTVGTSGALRVMYEGEPPQLPQGLWTYRLDGRRLVSGGALSNGGNLYSWLMATLRVDAGGLERRLGRMSPAAHGLTVLPHLAGQRSLGYAPHARGAIVGLRSSTTSEEILRAGLEAVALDFAAVDQRLDQVLPGATRLVASGAGLLASPAWMRIMADGIGRPLAVGRVQEASSRGAAVFALEWLKLARAADLDPGHERVLRPRAPATATYRRAQARQERLYDLLIAQGGRDPGQPLGE